LEHDEKGKYSTTVFVIFDSEFTILIQSRLAEIVWQAFGDYGI